jgi:hypothetical protein
MTIWQLTMAGAEQLLAFFITPNVASPPDRVIAHACAMTPRF